MEVEIIGANVSKPLGRVQVNESSTILDIKKGIHKFDKNLYVERQLLRAEPRGKPFKDTDRVKDLGLTNGSKLYLKDLGPQIGWSTVFLCEYAGPLFTYLLFYMRPSIVYGEKAASQPMNSVVHLAALCWSLHYGKRLYETVFIHRFSHATMPIMNLFKNCAYYWGFAAFVSFYVNHPKYTPPSSLQVIFGLALFAACELGNLSIHIALRDLRPPGTKVRRIPYPTSNPFTMLFDYVSCPNYTYEFGSWLGFTIMTSALPAAIFATAGMYQMSVWALGKHRNYKKEFSDYPKKRTAILPFLL